MKIQFIKDQDFEQYFDRAFNAPCIASQQDVDAFNAEYDMVQQAIKGNLLFLGGRDDPLDGDFVMNEGHKSSRWISIQLNTDKLACPQIIDDIAQSLQLFQQDYVVYITHDSIDEPLFHILVFKNIAFTTQTHSVWQSKIISKNN